MKKTYSCAKAGVACNSICHKNLKGSNPNCVNKKEKLNDQDAELTELLMV